VFLQMGLTENALFLIVVARFVDVVDVVDVWFWNQI
jgi:hypothetical protein